MNLSRRPATEADFEQVYRLRREAYEPYAIRHFGGWDDADEREHLRSQWNERTRAILVLNGWDIGCIDFIVGPQRAWLGNIILEPSMRNQGLGRAVLEHWLRWVDRHGLETGLNVYRDNPAVRLYERLGFAVTKEDPPYLLMVRPARAGA